MPGPTRYAVVAKLLKQHGWTLDRIKGSHHAFAKEGEPPLIIPVHHNQVKAVYVRKIKKQLGVRED